MGKFKVKRVNFPYELEEILSKLKRKQIISITEDDKGYTVVYEEKRKWLKAMLNQD